MKSRFGKLICGYVDPHRAFVGSIIAVGMFIAPVSAIAGAENAEKIVGLDRAAKPTEPGKFPPQMVVKTNRAFDGSYTMATGYTSKDRKFIVAIWQSGPGIIKTEGYPHDEYCSVLEGHVIITNSDGTSHAYGPGDSFVIPKGWVGTWNMTTRFKKQAVAYEENPDEVPR